MDPEVINIMGSCSVICDEGHAEPIGCSSYDLCMKRTHARNSAKEARRPTELRIWLIFVALILFSAQGEAQERDLPTLGSEVPRQVFRSRTHSKQCLTDINHQDPCTSVTIKKMLFTIAWDIDTRAITYVFTDDRRFLTDSELGVGGWCKLTDESGKADALVQYLNWLVTPKWADTAGNLSGAAIWYAALSRTSNPKRGRIVGFVQSRYVKVGQ